MTSDATIGEGVAYEGFFASANKPFKGAPGTSEKARFAS